MLDSNERKLKRFIEKLDKVFFDAYQSFYLYDEIIKKNRLIMREKIKRKVILIYIISIIIFFLRLSNH